MMKMLIGPFGMRITSSSTGGPVRRVECYRLPCPMLIELNQTLLGQLGVDDAWFRSDEGLDVLSGNVINNGNRLIAMAYAGHQFGHWSPLLGDGRAHMLGKMTGDNGSTIDAQLKGSGRTQFSRGGDSRATLVGDGQAVQKPCEMTSNKVIDFVLGFELNQHSVATVTGEVVPFKRMHVQR